MLLKNSFILGLSVATLLSSAGCSTAPFMIESNPAGSTLSMGIPGQAQKNVGNTPYEIKPGDISDSSSPLMLTISKDGFKTTSVILPPTLGSKSGKVSVRLEENILPAQCTNQMQALNNLAKGVAEAQSLIKSKQLEQAEKVISNLLLDFSGLSVIHDLQGNIYYLKKDFDKALSSYKKSIALAPDNLNTQRVIKQLEDIRGSGKGSN